MYKCFTDSVIERNNIGIFGADEAFVKMMMQFGNIAHHIRINMSAFQKNKFRLRIVIDLTDDIVMYYDKDKRGK